MMKSIFILFSCISILNFANSSVGHYYAILNSTGLMVSTFSSDTTNFITLTCIPPHASTVNTPFQSRIDVAIDCYYDSIQKTNFSENVIDCGRRLHIKPSDLLNPQRMKNLFGVFCDLECDLRSNVFQNVGYTCEGFMLDFVEVSVNLLEVPLLTGNPHFEISKNLLRYSENADMKSGILDHNFIVSSNVNRSTDLPSFERPQLAIVIIMDKLSLKLLNDILDPYIKNTLYNNAANEKMTIALSSSDLEILSLTLHSIPLIRFFQQLHSLSPFWCYVSSIIGIDTKLLDEILEYSKRDISARYLESTMKVIDDDTLETYLRLRGDVMVVYAHQILAHITEGNIATHIQKINYANSLNKENNQVLNDLLIYDILSDVLFESNFDVFMFVSTSLTKSAYPVVDNKMMWTPLLTLLTNNNLGVWIDSSSINDCMEQCVLGLLDGKCLDTSVIMISKHHLLANNNQIIPSSMKYILSLIDIKSNIKIDSPFTLSMNAFNLLAIYLSDLYRPFSLLHVPPGGGHSLSNIEEFSKCHFAKASYNSCDENKTYARHACAVNASGTDTSFSLSEEWRGEYMLGMSRSRMKIWANIEEYGHSWSAKRDITSDSLVYNNNDLLYRPIRNVECKECASINTTSAGEVVSVSDRVSSFEATADNTITRKAIKKKKPEVKFAVFTAIIGDFELYCPTFQKQSFPTDFICFTTSIRVATHPKSQSWIIDMYPYHRDESILQAIGLDDGTQINSLANNNHTYNICKFYKMNFYVFPRMQQYDYVVWIDGSLTTRNNQMTQILYSKMLHGANILIFEHSRKSLETEVYLSIIDKRYMHTQWNGQHQPLQNVSLQYETYLQHGYSESLWKSIQPFRPFYGMWVTCFMAFNMRHDETLLFLRNWYHHNLVFSTAEQIALPYLSQALKIYPYSLPDDTILGTFYSNIFYSKKNGHGLS